MAKRLCASCGKLVKAGMVDNDCSFYAHEGKCFINYMNSIYGKHKWMPLGNGEQDELGGYYIHTADVAGGHEGTGIYYTEWEDE